MYLLRRSFQCDANNTFGRRCASTSPQLQVTSSQRPLQEPLPAPSPSPSPSPALLEQKNRWKRVRLKVEKRGRALMFPNSPVISNKSWLGLMQWWRKEWKLLVMGTCQCMLPKVRQCAKNVTGSFLKQGFWKGTSERFTRGRGDISAKSVTKVTTVEQPLNYIKVRSMRVKVTNVQ